MARESRDFNLSNAIPSHVLGVQEKYVKFVTDKKKLSYFQTPLGSITHVSNNTLTVLFSTLDKKNLAFKNDVLNMFIKTHALLRHQCPNHKIELVSPITDHHDDKFSMMFDKANNVSFFECDKISSEFHILVSHAYDFIIQYSKVKILSDVCEEKNKKNKKNKNAKMIFTMCQIRRHDTTTNIKFMPCALLPRSIPNSTTLQSSPLQSKEVEEPHENSFIRHPKLGIYFKMLQKKVPIQAVKQKMYLDKVSEEILNFKSHDIIPENILQTYSDDDKSNMLIEMMENKKNELKKTETNVVKYRGYDLGISLEDITNRLFGLKKTNLLK